MLTASYPRTKYRRIIQEGLSSTFNSMESLINCPLVSLTYLVKHTFPKLTRQRKLFSLSGQRKSVNKFCCTFSPLTRPSLRENIKSQRFVRGIFFVCYKNKCVQIFIWQEVVPNNIFGREHVWIFFLMIQLRWLNR